MDKLEKLVRSKLGGAVGAGLGKWAEGSEPFIGRLIYEVNDGPASLFIGNLGFRYVRGSETIAFRYSEVDSIRPAPLADIMNLRGNLSAVVPFVVVADDGARVAQIDLTLRVYSEVSMVLKQVVDRLA